MNNEPIGLFDSGIGGLTVLSECRRVLPNENYVYFADFKNAPYGNKTAGEIFDLAYKSLKKLDSLGCKCAVIACNTATNVGAELLRKQFSFPIIGLEPAVKPAYEKLKSGKVLVLCTVATSKQEKFRKLIKTFDENKLIIAPQKDLAQLIEKNIYTLESIKPKITEILSVYNNVGSVVLGCTHYIFIRKYVEEFYQNKIEVFDGNAGAAKRLKSQLADKDLLSSNQISGCVKFV